ncbi:MAG TPA: phosphopyruvate hydratase, partial [Nitrososphaerales archaeon]|nr:phosphopyruvate hydratase [Nitrososphaerales archaeon]
NAGYDEGDVRMGIDAAASTFFNEGRSVYGIDGRELSEAKLEDFYVRLVDEFGLLTIEDPFQEDAFEAFAGLTRRLGRKVKVIGDDIYVTNIERIRMGMKKGATNAVLIKLNQIGTLTETEGAIKESDRGGLVVVVSHRSGETDDPFIAHLATAFSSSFIKAGAPARGERTAKYNELIRIEEELGSRSSYTGMKAAG